MNKKSEGHPRTSLKLESLIVPLDYQISATIRRGNLKTSKTALQGVFMAISRSFFFILFFGISCTTNRCYPGCEAESKSAKSDADPILLRKVVGALNKELPEKQQHFDCSLRASQLKEFPLVRELIEKAIKAPLGVKYIFVPIVPSQEYTAFQEGKEFVLHKAGDAIEFRQPEKEEQLENLEVKQLRTIIDGLCKN
jgi:hypothetical protein